MTSRAAARQRGGGWSHGRHRAGEMCADERDVTFFTALFPFPAMAIVGCVAAEWALGKNGDFSYWSSLRVIAKKEART